VIRLNRYYITAIIAAAGKGTRMNANTNKQYIHLKDKPILAHTISIFENHPSVNEIIIVVGKNEKEKCNNEIIKPYGFKKIKSLVTGGETRQQSMYNGLKEVSKDTDIVITHDGARPLLEEMILSESIKKTIVHGATVVGVPVKNTIKKVDSEGFIKKTLNRELLWNIQTPQSFLYSLLLKAHNTAKEAGFIGTDDAMLVEYIGHPIKLIWGNEDNIKITTQEDLDFAELILSKR
jgi:2-C-methyl-D-erythritol 4-phosphate cytidylyltransferase